MTRKQQCFVDEYLIDLNATQAAIRAGYSPKSATEIGHENMRKPHIRMSIDRAIAERSRRTGISADRVVRELARLAFINADDLIDFDTATVRPGAAEDDTAAIAGVRVKTASSGSEEREITLFNKLKALELLGRHLGMFTDRLDLATQLVIIRDDIEGV